jgi:hypothetical protein
MSTAMTRPSIQRCSTATNTGSAVVGLLQASYSNPYHHGICPTPFTDEVADGYLDRSDGERMRSTTPASEHNSSWHPIPQQVRQHMLAITENITDASAHRPAISTLRLRLKPAHRSCGFVQGAWWPRSTELTSELPTLLAALSLRVGSIDCVLYHEDDWSPAPLNIEHQGDQVSLGAHQEWPNVVSLFGPRFGSMELLVVPPHTEPAHAYNLVTTAAHVNDASTPDQLLGIGTRRAGDPLPSPVALQRWESDGGAQPPPPRCKAQMQDA